MTGAAVTTEAAVAGPAVSGAAASAVAPAAPPGRSSSIPASLVGLVIGLAALAAGLATWRGGFWLTNDGPQHLFAAFASLHLDEPSLGFSRYLERSDAATSLGYLWLFRLLEPSLGWELAHRWITLVVVELWGFSVLALVAAVEPRRAILGVLGFPTAFQLFFFVGLLQFLLGAALGMFAISAWLRIQPRGVRTLVVVALLATAGRCHIVAAGIAGAAIGVATLTAGRRIQRRDLWALAACALPLVLIGVEGQLGAAADRLTSEHDGPSSWRPAWLIHLVCSFQPGPLWRGGGLLALAGLGAVCAGRQPGPQRVWALLAGALVLFSWLAPPTVFGWELGGLRLLPIASIVLVALISFERWRPPARRALVGVVLAYAVASLMWAGRSATEHAARAQIVLAPLQKLAPKPRFLVPAILDPCLGPCDPQIPWVAPAFQTGQLYAIRLGGEAAYGFHSLPAIHQVLSKPDPTRIDPPAVSYWMSSGPARAAMLERLPVWLSLQEAVLVVSAPAELQRFRDAGFQAELDTGRVFVGTFVGCRGTVVAPGRAGARAWVGAHPLDEPSAAVTLGPDGTAVVEKIPCGPVWLALEGAACATRGDHGRQTASWRQNLDNTLACDPP